MKWTAAEKKRRTKAQKEQIEREQEKLESGGYFKAKEGNNTIRVLPRESSALPYLKVKEIQFDGGNNLFFSCVSPKTKDEDAYDYILDTVLPNLRAGSDEDQKLALKFKIQNRAYFEVLDWDAVGIGPQIWALNVTKKGIYNKVLSLMNDPDYGAIDFPDEDGTDLNLHRTGTGFSNTEYTLLPKKNTRVVPDEVLEEIFDLEEKFRPMNPTEQQQLVLNKLKIEFDLEEGDEIPFDRPEPDSEPEPEPEPKKEEKVQAKEAEEDIVRVAIEVPDEENLQASLCFGVLFEGQDVVCLGCEAFLKCAKATAEQEMSPPSTGKGSRRKARATG